MNILWIVNTIFPEPSIELGLKRPVVGGWMYDIGKRLAEEDTINLSVATTYSEDKFSKMKIGNINYFLLPSHNKIEYDNKLEQFWEKVFFEIKPDLIHIHGTEYALGLACMKKFPEYNYIISIQGLVSIITRYFYAGISVFEIIKNITIHDFLRKNTIFNLKKQFKKRGEIEKEYIKQTKHVIGRTDWDFAHTHTINNKLNYHFCNESLRSNFYISKKWTIENCNAYTIFLSQAGYPLKGFHQVIKAVSILKKEFPSIQIRIAGVNTIKSDNFNDRIRLSGYGKYLIKLIKKLNLKNNILFLGSLSEEQIIKEYLKANVFICPSSIENSSNSLGEAQLLGVPVIASYVGGIPNMVVNGDTGLLYRFEEIEMLAQNIRHIFKNIHLAEHLSKNEIKAANLRHDREKNLKDLKEIYFKIIK